MASKIPVPMPSRDQLVQLYFKELFTYAQIGERYGVSGPTVCKWFQIYKLDPKAKYAPVKIAGKLHKWCYGPTHPPGGELLLLSKFHKDRCKKYGVHSQCAACNRAEQRVEFSKYKAWVESILRRLGFRESARRLEISERQLHEWLNHSPMTILRPNAVKIATLMLELRQTGEVRHRKSIHRGAKFRGEEERKVKGAHDLYKPHGDIDTENARIRRQRLRNEEAA